MNNMDRRALLARAGAGAGALALLGVVASPASAAGDVDLSNVRLVCSCKVMLIHWYTEWLDAGAKWAPDFDQRKAVLGIRLQEEAQYALLAPMLNGTAPADDDFTFTFPKGAMRSSTLATGFSLNLEELVTGIGIGAAATTTDAGIATNLGQVLAGDAQHAGTLSGLLGKSTNPDGLPTPYDVQDASNQLAQFLS
jgi:Ferritin-like domain